MASRRTTKTEPIALDGTLWMTVGAENLGGHGRMALLRAIAEQGSITQAAKAYGMSYKAAWDAIATMNRLAGEPLVERSLGGRGGGSSRLTPQGERLVARFSQIEAAHRRFLKLLNDESIALDRDFSWLQVLNMKTSARNQWLGSVSAIRAGAVNDEVELTLPGGARLVAIVTRESTQSLGLRLGLTAIAIVESASVIVATGLQGARLSARNQLTGAVSALTPGAVNAEVVIDVDGGGQIAAIVTQASVHDLGLAPGVRATALFKASAVIVAVIA